MTFRWSTRLVKTLTYRVLSIAVQLAFVNWLIAFHVTNALVWGPYVLVLNGALIGLYYGLDLTFERVSQMKIGPKFLYPRLGFIPLKVRAIVANARPFTLLLPIVGGWLIIQASLGRFSLFTPNLTLTLLAILTMMLINATGNYFNSYYDYEIDKINKPYRPLPTHALSKMEVLWLGLLGVLLSMGMSIFVNGAYHMFPFSISASIALVLTVLYSTPPIRLKRILWINNATQAVVRGVIFPIAMWSIYAPLNANILAICAVLFTFILFAQSIKDVDDVKGDAAFGIQTLPVKYGIETTNRIMVLGCAATLGLMGILAGANILKLLSFAFFVPFVIAFIYLLDKRIQSPFENRLAWSGFYVCLISLLLGWMMSLTIAI